MTEAPTRPVVLVVEDDRDIRGLLRRRIERLGHDVVEAATGEAALELAREHRPMLVMLDIQLPGIDGWEVLRRLRDDDEFGDIPVMVVSIVEDPGTGARAPVQGYVLKPFRAAEIDGLVRRLATDTIAPSETGRPHREEPGAP
jgi:two-component system OmpR family response regulator